MPTFRVLPKDDPRIRYSRETKREMRLRPYINFLKDLAPETPFELEVGPDDTRMNASKSLFAAARDLDLTIVRLSQPHLIYQVSVNPTPAS